MKAAWSGGNWAETITNGTVSDHHIHSRFGQCMAKRTFGLARFD